MGGYYSFKVYVCVGIILLRYIIMCLWVLLFYSHYCLLRLKSYIMYTLHTPSKLCCNVTWDQKRYEIVSCHTITVSNKFQVRIRKRSLKVYSTIMMH